jgi:hypothetical protein
MKEKPNWGTVPTAGVTREILDAYRWLVDLSVWVICDGGVRYRTLERLMEQLLVVPLQNLTVMNHETNDAVRYVVAERRMCRRLTDFERDYMSWERRMADADS